MSKILRDSDLILEAPWLPRQQRKGSSYIKVLLHSKQKTGKFYYESEQTTIQALIEHMPNLNAVSHTISSY